MERSYRFGEFRVDIAGERLIRAGEPIHLEPRVFQLLVHLLRNRDRVVGKDELVAAVWADAFVTDAALTQAIARLRRALGDPAQEPRYIETAHTRGYRFVAEVDEAPAAEELPVTAHYGAWVVAAGLTALVAMAIWLPLSRRPNEPAASGGKPEIRSLAVLPLRSIPPDPEQDYLADGLHELLVTELASLGPVRVIARQSTLGYRDPSGPVSEIAARLGVDGIIQGSIARAEDSVRVSIQFIDGSTEEHLWARSFERRDDDVLGLLGDLAGAVAQEIGVVLRLEQESRLAAYAANDPAAQRAFLRARYLLNQGHPRSLREAERWFRETIELEPEFAPAYSGLAVAQALPVFFGQVRFAAVAPLAEQAAMRAVELDPRLAEARSALAFVRLYFDRDFDAAGRELELAIELNPNDAFVRHGYGDYLTVLGRLEEGLEQVRIGRRTDPLSPLSIAPVAGHLFFLERYEDVVEEVRVMLELDPHFFLARSLLFQALWELGRHEEAIEVKREEWAERDPEALAALERGWREGGATGAMAALADLFVERYRGTPRLALYVARYETAAGRYDSALEHLERALEARVPQLLHLEADPGFDPLRDHPRYGELVRRIGFPAAVDARSTG